MCVCECGHLRRLAAYYALCACREFSSADERCLHIVFRAECHIAIDCWEIEVTPVYANGVAFLGEYGLLNGAGAHIFHTVVLNSGRHCGLRRLIDSHKRRGAEVELHVVALAVGGAHLIGNVIDGSGKEVVIVDEHRGGEHHVKLHRTASERVIRRCGEHAHLLLLCRLHSGVLLCYVAVESEVDVCTAEIVVAVSGNDVLSGAKQSHGLVAETLFHTLTESVAGAHHLGTVDVEFEIVVVGVHHPKLTFQVCLRKVHSAAHIDVGIEFAPYGIDISETLGTEGGAAFTPSVGVVVGGCPVAIRGLACVCRCPCALVCHGYNALQHLAFGSAHEAVGLAIDTQKSFQRFLVAGPVGCCTIGKTVVGRPDREIRVGNHERD